MREGLVVGGGGTCSLSLVARKALGAGPDGEHEVLAPGVDMETVGGGACKMEVRGADQQCGGDRTEIQT